MTEGVAKSNASDRCAIITFDCCFPDLSAFLRNLGLGALLVICFLTSVYVFILSFN